MTDHPHEQQIAMYGECLTCVVRAGSGREDVHVEPPAFPPDLFQEPTPDSDGATYRRSRDYQRLGAQARRVWDAMADGQWHTLADLHARTQDPEASISARLRDFRKEEWGGHKVEHRNDGAGTWSYRLVMGR